MTTGAIQFPCSICGAIDNPNSGHIHAAGPVTYTGDLPARSWLNPPIMPQPIALFTIQACPVCQGRGNVPIDFYAQIGATTDLSSREQCHTCDGSGLLKVGTFTGVVEKVQVKP